MQVKIYKLEDNTNPLCILPQGKHILGRGTQLACNDKRVSRSHLSILIEVSNASFSLLHQTNPCYWKCAGSRNITLLKPNSPVEINDGDTFGFFPGKHWFRIKCSETNIVNNNMAAASVGSTQPTLTSPVAETFCRQESSVVEDSDIQRESVVAEDSIRQTEQRDEVAQTSLVEVENTTLCNEQHNIEVSQEDKKKVDINSESTTEIANNQPSCSHGETSTNGKLLDKKFKDRCWYGANCYRKNDNHRLQFSHPGDADYETDPEDNRPACPYGRGCYRRNADHRKNFKHSQVTNRTSLKRPIEDDDDNEEDDSDEDTGAVNTANILPNPRKRKMKKQNFADENEDDGEEDAFATDEDDDYEMSDSDE